jgi:CheY-like chemotaxis protein
VARTIMIADDSPTVQKKASGILTGEGMEVVTVSNGVAAIKKLPTVKPMVILADVSMPGKDGYEVCEFVKASADFPNVPVVLVFSDDDIYDEQKGARARADGRIKKPFDRDELISTVNRFLAISEVAHTPVGATVIYKIPPRPRPAPAVEPVDEEPDYVPKKAEPDFSAFEGTGAFPETPLEDMGAPPPEPATAYEPEAAPEPVPSFDSAAPFEAPTAEPEPPPSYPEEQMLAPEAPFSAEGAVEPMPEAAPPPPAEPPQEEIPAEPVFIEEQAAPPPPPPAPPAPEMARTMMFRLSDIAQPVLSDEMAPAVAEPSAEVPPEATAPEAAVAEGEQVLPPEPEAPPVSAASLESFSLSEAAAGHVRFSAFEEEAPAAAAPTIEQEAPAAAAPTIEQEAPTAAAPAVEEEEPAAVAPEEAVAAPAPAPTPSAIDPAQVYTIVQMVVAKMSPRMGAQSIADMARNLADEINAELNASSAPKP